MRKQLESLALYVDHATWEAYKDDPQIDNMTSLWNLPHTRAGKLLHSVNYSSKQLKALLPDLKAYKAHREDVQHLTHSYYDDLYVWAGYLLAAHYDLTINMAVHVNFLDLWAPKAGLGLTPYKHYSCRKGHLKWTRKYGKIYMGPPGELTVEKHSLKHMGNPLVLSNIKLP